MQDNSIVHLSAVSCAISYRALLTEFVSDSVSLKIKYFQALLKAQYHKRNYVHMFASHVHMF